MDEILRYTDLAHTIQMARAHGFTTREIVRVLSGSLPYAEVRELAKRAAPLLGLTVQEFLNLRKND
jgi:hypothetical protein